MEAKRCAARATERDCWPGFAQAFHLAELGVRLVLVMQRLQGCTAPFVL